MTNIFFNVITALLVELLVICFHSALNLVRKRFDSFRAILTNVLHSALTNSNSI